MDARLVLLANATVQLTSSLDYSNTLRAVAASTVPVLGDFCFIDMIAANGSTLERLAWAHTDPKWQERFNHVAPLMAEQDVLVERVLASGTTAVFLTADNAWKRVAGESLEYLQFLRALNFHSLLVVPLIAHDQQIGALTLGLVDPTHVYDIHDELFAEQLARVAALAVHNARLYQHEQDLHQQQREIRKSAEAAEAQYHGLFDGVLDAVLVIDESGAYIDANPAAVALFGYSVEEFRSKSVGDLTPAGSNNELSPAARFELLRTQGSYHGEATLQRKDGSTFLAEGKTHAIHLPTGVVYLTTTRDITHRREMERQARALQREQEARTVAEQLVRERDEFLAVAAHELRTPVTSTRGYVGMLTRALEHGEIRPDKLMHYAQAITKGTERQVSLIHNLLDVTKLRTGQFVVRLESLDLLSFVRDISCRFAENLPAQHALSLSAEGPPTWVRADSGRLEQIIVNLLNNAVKYSPNGGSVRVCVEQEENGVTVSVSDTGIGIPSESLGAIFQPFRRATNSRARQFGGLGLGLYIAKEITDAHDGRIWADSDGENRGSTFSLWLPLVR